MRSRLGVTMGLFFGFITKKLAKVRNLPVSLSSGRHGCHYRHLEDVSVLGCRL